MSDHNLICKACGGSGLLADDENWKYCCTVCGGDGKLELGDSLKPAGINSVDETNRIFD